MSSGKIEPARCRQVLAEEQVDVFGRDGGREGMPVGVHPHRHVAPFLEQDPGAGALWRGGHKQSEKLLLERGCLAHLMRDVIREALREVIREALREVIREALREFIREAMREVIREAMREVIRD